VVFPAVGRITSSKFSVIIRCRRGPELAPAYELSVIFGTSQ